MEEFDAKESTNIRWARYNAAEQKLQIDFKNSTGKLTSTYEYQNFTVSDWRALQAAESKGRHFAIHIRNARNTDGTLKYPATRVTK